MDICKEHNRPLVRTFAGNDICFPCFFARMKARSGPTRSQKDAERTKDYRARVKEGRPGRRAEKQAAKS
jgi:hypothetical protein